MSTTLESPTVTRVEQEAGVFVCSLEGCERTAVVALLVLHWEDCETPEWVLMCTIHYHAAMRMVRELERLTAAGKTLICEKCLRPVSAEDALRAVKPL